jgi:hypothetical protein
MLENLEAAMSNELSVATVVINLLCAAGLSILLSWHFNAFASTFSNRKKFGNVLPFIALTTVLVISIVKASLALSLGLVGALSIVRFRTPVKEPEELAYLFLAIALGLGFGADQRIVTIAAVGVILGILTIRSLMTARKWTPNLYLNIDIPPSDQQSKPVVLKEVLGVLQAHTSRVDLRRYDVQAGSFAGTFYVDCDNADQLNAVQEAVQCSYPTASVTFIDQTALPGA